jgi:hypothetical protein
LHREEVQLLDPDLTGSGTHTREAEGDRVTGRIGGENESVIGERAAPVEVVRCLDLARAVPDRLGPAGRGQRLQHQE